MTMSTQDEIEAESPSSAPDTMEATSSSSSRSSSIAKVVPTKEEEEEEEEQQSNQKSALRENIDSKGKNAYYYAHGHKATGPKWDGKVEPKLLSRQSSSSGVEGHGVSSHKTASSFEYYKSNITTYAFLDDETKVKLYIDMKGVGEKCTAEDIQLDFTETSLSLVVNNYKPEKQCLSFGKLFADIKNATFLKKKDRIILTLTKADAGASGEQQCWHTINDKGSPDHEVV